MICLGREGLSEGSLERFGLCVPVCVFVYLYLCKCTKVKPAHIELRGEGWGGQPPYYRPISLAEEGAQSKRNADFIDTEGAFCEDTASSH